MDTFNRICIKDYEVKEDNKIFNLKRGKEYLTSQEDKGKVVVFSSSWAKVPVDLFAGELQFTKD